jgi:methyltransferase
MIAYLVFVLATGVERLVEVVISTRHARWAFARGGVEFGQKHFPWMVALHTALLVGALAEVFLLDRPFVPWLGWPMLAIALLCQLGRYWVIWALGEQWNTRVIVVPGLSPSHAGTVPLPLATPPQLPHRCRRRHRPSPRSQRVDHRHCVHRS